MENIEFLKKVEESIILNSGITREDFDAKFSSFKEVNNEEKSDNRYFDIIKFLVYSSGLKTQVVDNKIEIINKYFPDYQTAAKYSKEDISNILSDENMIKHPGKADGIVKNANIISALVNEFGSIKNYIDSLISDNSIDNLKDIYKNIKAKFSYLGELTTFDFMNKIGLDVVMPSSSIRRFLERLGLIEEEIKEWSPDTEQQKIEKHFILNEFILEFSQETNNSVNYINEVFQLFCKDICKEEPKCELCPSNDICNFNKSYSVKKAEKEYDEFIESAVNTEQETAFTIIASFGAISGWLFAEFPLTQENIKLQIYEMAIFSMKEVYSLSDEFSVKALKIGRKFGEIYFQNNEFYFRGLMKACGATNLGSENVGDLVLFLCFINSVLNNYESWEIRDKYNSNIHSICCDQLEAENIFEETQKASNEFFERSSEYLQTQYPVEKIEDTNSDKEVENNGFPEDFDEDEFVKNAKALLGDLF